jgi:HAD superfamily hydrolase (TIGR01509 family)
MESLGARWSDEDAIHCLGGPMARVDAYMRSKLPIEKQEEFGEGAITAILLEAMAERFKVRVPFAPGAKELIDQMDTLAIPMALVTASNRAIMEGALGSIGRGYFKTTISDNDVERSKPDPEGYQLAAARIGVPIQDCLIIEDSITGASAAIASGAYLLGLTHSGPLPIGDKVCHIENLIALELSGIVELFQPLLVKS